ncbi:unnamed protein product [Lactuca virosa]|uniref:BHLH domain-containing protein n=1 Tax=Lactuca virosa TaxID=75947 RepID=A0AAU9PJE8_9ASTR|nr:unnamed protein product [Lactuca virosa]
MESVSTLLEGERNYFSGTYVSEEADFMAQLLGNFSTKSPKTSTFDDSSSSSSAFWSQSHHESTMKDDYEASISISDNTNTNSLLFPTSSGESYLSISSSGGNNKRGISVIPFFSKMEGEEATEFDNMTPSSRKRSYSFDDVQMGWKKTKFTSMNDSDDDSNRLQDLSPRPQGVPMANSSGKKRASNGSATDSQSVYAKKRRERINERLRILQSLVPNGTKVDISTMLEEAVQYVKFLQLQIKLLSSDDLWMYAPLAYNGMDIGLDITLPSPR